MLVFWDSRLLGQMKEKPLAPSLRVPKYIQLGLSFHSMESTWRTSSPIDAASICKLVGQTRKHAGHTLAIAFLDDSRLKENKGQRLVLREKQDT